MIMNPSSEESARAKQVAKAMAVSSLMSNQLDDSTETSNTDGSDRDASEDEEEFGEREIKEEPDEEEASADEDRSAVAGAASVSQFDGTDPVEDPELRHEEQAGKGCQVDQKHLPRALQVAPSQPFSQRRNQQQQQQLQLHHQHQQPIGDCEEVKQVELFGVCIVALTINGKQRLCLAQISNTLLKELSYNEIHNRRVALGITCIQCTPIQLEILRRAGAMPSSSRRCGMITLREAERLCRSFLVEEQPPDLPENFYFTVAHRVNYGCKGRFVPARYISSRAKCIECFYCGDFYSPNKFIFHSHRQPHNTDCNPPDSPNINSWRKHIDLDWNHEHNQEIKYAWEDVKSLFNGGTRRRAPNSNGQQSSTTATTGATGHRLEPRNPAIQQQQRRQQAFKVDEPEQLIDVECDLDQPQPTDSSRTSASATFKLNSSKQSLAELVQGGQPTNRTPNRAGKQVWTDQARYGQQASSAGLASEADSLILETRPANQAANMMPPAKRFLSGGQPSSAVSSKRFMSATDSAHLDKLQRDASLPDERPNNFSTLNPGISSANSPCHQPNPMTQARLPSLALDGRQSLPARSQLPFTDFLAAPSGRPIHHHQQQQGNLRKPNNAQPNLAASYPASSLTSNFIYSQLYTQLMQPQQANLQQSQQQQPQLLGSTMDAQLALRNHLWSSLLALQCNAGNQQTYSGQQTSHCSTPISGDPADVQACSNQLSHLISASQMYGPQTNLAAVAAAAVAAKLHQPPNQGSLGTYKQAQSGSFSLHKFSTETNDI